jgi:hypothetical protein
MPADRPVAEALRSALIRRVAAECDVPLEAVRF